MHAPQESARARFDVLLAEMFDHPERRREIEAAIEAEFERDCAVMVLDTSGFSRTTRSHGIYTFLLMIHQMKRLSRPIVQAHGGGVIKEEADNLFCLFDSVAQAVSCAHGIMAELEVVNDTLPPELRIFASIGIARGRVLDLGGEDMWGDAVNTACKLGEDIAEKKQILITREAYAELPADAHPARLETVAVSGLTLDFMVLKEDA